MNSQHDHYVYRRQVEQQSDIVKSNLRKTITTRLKTSFIFPIAEFERLFGHLWDETSTSEEVEGPEFYKNLFVELRKRVLDNGNNQIRAFDKDLDGHDVRITEGH